MCRQGTHGGSAKCWLRALNSGVPPGGPFKQNHFATHDLDAPHSLRASLASSAVRDDTASATINTCLPALLQLKGSLRYTDMRFQYPRSEPWPLASRVRQRLIQYAAAMQRIVFPDYRASASQLSSGRYGRALRYCSGKYGRNWQVHFATNQPGSSDNDQSDSGPERRPAIWLNIKLPPGSRERVQNAAWRPAK